MTYSPFIRVVAGIASSALIAAGMIVGIGTAASASTPVTASVDPLSCRDNIPYTDFLADSADPDLINNVHADLYMLINKARVSAGQKPYATSRILTNAAEGWAAGGAHANDLNHASQELRQASLPAGFIRDGENIFSGADGSKAPYIFNMWMNSELHRANILCPTFTHIGSGQNSPRGGGRLHVVQRFAAYPDAINPDDESTWLPFFTPAPALVTKEQNASEFVADTSLNAESMTTYQRAAIKRINELRVEAGVEPLAVGTHLTNSIHNHLFSFADSDWAEQEINNYPVTTDPKLLSTALTGSGTDAGEMVLSRKTAKTGQEDVDFLYAKGGIWKTVILDPHWTHVGSAQVAETYLNVTGFYSGLRFASYQPLPAPVEQNNSWNAESVNLYAGQSPDVQVAVIESDGPVYLQVQDGAKWVTKDTFTAVNGHAQIVFPASNAGTLKYRLVSPANGMKFLEWISPTLTVVAEKRVQSNTWISGTVTSLVGTAPKGTSAKIQGSNTVILQESNAGNWKDVTAFPVINGSATISFPVQKSEGSTAYRLYSPGNGLYAPWFSSTVSVVVTKGVQTNSFDTTALTSVVNSRPSNRIANIVGSNTLILQEQTGNAWKNVSTFSVINNQATVVFPLQTSVGSKIYRIHSPGNTSYAPWTSSNITVTTTKVTPNNSFSNSGATSNVGNRPADRTAMIQGVTSVALQEQRGNTWTTVSTFVVKDGKTTIKFPIQAAAGTKNYRLHTAATATHNAWTSNIMKVVSKKINQKSSWTTTASTFYFGAKIPARTATIQAKGTVTLQQYVGGKWKNVKTISASKGKASVSFAKPSIGIHKFRLYSAGNATYNAWTSPTYKVVVKGKKQTGTIGNHDFNGDGKADLLSVNSAGKLYVLLGNGKGKFKKKLVGSGYKSYKHVVATADLTGDGKADMILVKSNGKAYIAPGNGKGKFASKHIYIGSGMKNHKEIFSPGDINGDKYGDIIFRTNKGVAYVMYGNGDGTFKKAKKLSVNWKKYKSIAPGGDYNRDGKADVLLIDKNGKAILARGTGKSKFKNLTIGSGFKNVQKVSIPGNLNGGKFPDVIAVDSKGKVKMYAGKSAKKLLKAKNIASMGKKVRHLS